MTTATPTHPSLSPAATLLLCDALRLLDRGDAWTQGAYARTAALDVVGYQRPEATRWSLIGALWRCAGVEIYKSPTVQEVEAWLARRLRLPGAGYIDRWQDRVTWAEVEQVLSEAVG